MLAFALAENRRPLLSARPAIILLAAALLAAGAPGCDRKPLPERGSYAERIYVNRCGKCHVPYNPGAMTAAMWQLQVQMMQDKMSEAGVPPLSERQRAAILDYLTRNAGHE
jgi:Dihaem cytochrome c